PRPILPHTFDHREQLGLFAFASAPHDDHRAYLAVSRAPVPTGVERRHVIFQVAGHMKPFARNAQGGESRGVLFLPDGAEIEVLPERRHGEPYRPVIPKRMFRHSTVDQRYARSGALGFAQKVGPEFGFHRYKKLGAHDAEITSHDPREIN